MLHHRRRTIFHICDILRKHEGKLVDGTIWLFFALEFVGIVMHTYRNGIISQTPLQICLCLTHHSHQSITVCSRKLKNVDEHLRLLSHSYFFNPVT